MYGKPLAYTVKINEVNPIEGADRIEIAKVMDYSVVVKKGEYKPGDFAMYVEIDSLLPDGLDNAEDRARMDELTSMIKSDPDNADIKTEIAELTAKSKYPYFEFLRARKFKIKSMKLGKFGVISQGILFKPDELGLTKVKEGQDLTKQFNITEIVLDEEEAGLTSKKKDNFIVRWLMRYAWFRVWRKRKNPTETWDDSWPSKSDETNVQKVFTQMKRKYGDDGEWISTEKLEGQNITIYSEEVKSFFGKKSKRIGVCSRTREVSLRGNNGNSFWGTVKRLRLDEKIKAIPGEWFCRGEHVGPGIQGNIYQLPRTEVRFFDFYEKKNGKFIKLNWEETKAFSEKWDLPLVPVLDEDYHLPETCQEMLFESDKKTVFGNNLKHKREGFVLRRKEDMTVSFKVKNPEYSI